MIVARREFLVHEGDGPEANISKKDAGQDYALVVGVNDYPRAYSLRGAIADAQAFAAWLVNAGGGGLSNENVRIVLSTPDPLAPVGHEINDALEDLLERAKRDGGRRFYFYFSGHGCTGDRSSDVALCLANWSKVQRRAALSVDAWRDVVVCSGVFAEVAFFLDCCRSWAIRVVGQPPNIDIERPVERDDATRVFVAYATESLRAAREAENPSAGAPKVVRGLFTETLIDGLQGAAIDANGVVTASALKKYIESTTRERARNLRFHQRAEVLDGFDSSARFGLYVRPAPTPTLVPLEQSVEPMIPLEEKSADSDTFGAAMTPRMTMAQLVEQITMSESATNTAEAVFVERVGSESATNTAEAVLKSFGIEFFSRHTTAHGVDLPPTDSQEFDGPLYMYSEPGRRSAPATMARYRRNRTPRAMMDERFDETNQPPDSSPRFRMLEDERFDETNQPPPTARLVVDILRSSGAAWSLRHVDQYCDFSATTEFSHNLKPGSYTLVCSGAGRREVVVHLFLGWTTHIQIDEGIAPPVSSVHVPSDETFAPQFERIRVAFTRGENTRDSSAAYLMDAVAGLAMLTSGDGDSLHESLLHPSGFPRSTDSPEIAFLAAHLSARQKKPDIENIEDIVNMLELRLGRCPDVDALRLRIALLRGGDIPDDIRWTDPPMFREGLLAFVEASHQKPKLVPKGSLLEYACVERLVDSPLTCFPVRPDPGPQESAWLTAALAEIAVEHDLPLSPDDARKIAQKLGVPTLAVETTITKRRENMTATALGKSELPEWRQWQLWDKQVVDDLPMSVQLLEVRNRYETGNHKEALAIAELILCRHPSHLAALGYAESSRQMLRQKYLARVGDMTVVPRIKHEAIELARVDIDGPDMRIVDAIDGLLSVEEIVTAAGMPTLDVLRVLHDLVVDDLVEFVGPATGRR